MDFKQLKTKAIESSIASIISLIVGAIGATILWLFSDIPSSILKLFGTLPNTTLVRFSIGLVLVCLLEAIWIYIHRTRLKPYWGILWDKKLNPYCPSCKVLLGNYSTYIEPGWMQYQPGVKCAKCGKVYYFVTLRQQHVNLDTAKLEVARDVFNIKKLPEVPPFIVERR